MVFTKEHIIKEIENGASLKCFPDWIDDKEVVLEAVKQNGLVLGYASERLRDDKDIVLAAIKAAGWAYVYASDKIMGKLRKQENPIDFLEKWIKKEKFEQQLNKKNKNNKIKI